MQKEYFGNIFERQIAGTKFRRREPTGRYIVDFVTFENKLIVEIDGGQHSLEKENDQERDKWLSAQGFTILRFWNNEAMRNTNGVLDTIYKSCELLSPAPLIEKGQSRNERK